jgi:tripartite ATP-independent transporter DctP family solute receptor
MLQKIKLGTMHLTLPSSTMPEIANEYAIFDLPFLVANREHLARIDETLFTEVLVPAAEAQGYRPLAIWENGFRQITNNERPITTPADLDGLKIRTPNSSWRVAMFEAYGANPTPMAFSEVFTALQTGVIDGQENPYAQIASAKFQEVQKYLSITGHVYTPAYILTSKNQWDGWPDEVKSMLTDCANQTQDFTYEKAAALETELLQVIKDAGVEVNEADKDAFITASKPIYDAFSDEVSGGGEMIDQVLSLGSGS